MANTKNNKRRRESQRRIQEALIELLADRDLNRVTVTAICEKAHINRSTFYANYRDVYDLAENLGEWMDKQVTELFREEHEQSFNSNDYLKLFTHMCKYQDEYRLYFKLGLDRTVEITQWDTEQAQRHFDNRHIEYHMEFFRAGLNAIVRMWLDGGCKETPEEMNEIISSEYYGRKQLLEDGDALGVRV